MHRRAQIKSSGTSKDLNGFIPTIKIDHRFTKLVNCLHVLPNAERQRHSHDDFFDALLDEFCSFESVLLLLSLLLLPRKKFPKTLKTHLLLCRRADFVHAFSRRFSHIIELLVSLMNEIVCTFAHCICNLFNLFKKSAMNYSTVIYHRKEH